MFEKEAEEWVKENMDCCKTDNSVNQPIPYFDEEERCCAKSAFIDGAEFGYKKGQSDQLVHKQYQLNQFRKANEWHYVKDGDLPKDEKDILMSDQLILLTRMKGTDNLSISIGQYNFSTQEFNYQHIVGLTDVVAWKEIQLPKEIE